MFYSYPAFENRNSVKKFYVSRIGRIWPMHILAFFCAVLISAIPNAEVVAKGANLFETLTMTLASIFLVQSWIPIQNYYSSFYGHSWSISTEFFFLYSVPLVVKKWKSAWQIWLLGSGLLVVLFMFLCNFLESLPLEMATLVSRRRLCFMLDH